MHGETITLQPLNNPLIVRKIVHLRPSFRLHWYIDERILKENNNKNNVKKMLKSAEKTFEKMFFKQF